jgi:SAM-dependent methyltransferase
VTDAAAWHDVECASYVADLPLWRELAAEQEGPLLEVGCGTGRVALDLAAHGHAVTALDADPALVRELRRRARERSLRMEAVTADARSFALPGRFRLAIAPMQVTQLLGGVRGRARLLARIRAHLVPGGRFAAALADPFEEVTPADALLPLPDVQEQDGWVLSSRPIALRREPGVLAIDRLRQVVTPRGELSEELFTVRLDDVTPDALEAEAKAHRLRPSGRRTVPATLDHVGSTVVVLEAA